LVHQVVAPDELMTAALTMARSIVGNNAYGVWQTKIGLNTALDAPSLRHAIEIENRTQILSGFTNNPLEAATAHQEKRAPVWDPL
jgi:enoyl-CoA hydratase/carnithine racemase